MDGRRKIAAPIGSARAVSVATVIGRAAVAIPFLIGPLMLPSVLFRLVTADNATRTRPQQPMMTGKMPCSSADNRTL